MDVEKKAADELKWQNDVDGLADFYSRLSTCESVNVALARRVRALEDKNQGHYNADDPMVQMKGLFGGNDSMLTYALIIGVVMIVVEVIRQWPSLSSSAS
jgi:hypothetical protein